MPIAKSWDPLLPGYCFNLSDFAVAIEVPNSLLDFVIVALPVRVIKQLQLSVGNKITLSVVFVLGGLYAAQFPNHSQLRQLTETVSA